MMFYLKIFIDSVSSKMEKSYIEWVAKTTKNYRPCHKLILAPSEIRV